MINKERIIQAVIDSDEPSIVYLTTEAEEEWYDIPEYEGLYQYSTHLQIRRLRSTVLNSNGIKGVYRERIIKVTKHPKTYALLQICKNNKIKNIYMHSFFARIFIPNPLELPVVMHKDDDIHNYSLCNLKWGTSYDNVMDSVNKGRRVSNGSKMRGGLNVRARKVFDTSNEFVYDSIVDAANAYSIRQECLNKYLKGTRKNKTPLRFL